MSRPAPEVVLRPVEDADLPVFYEQQRDPDAVAMAVFPPRDEAAFMAHWARVRANPTGVNRTVVADGEVAGNVVSWVHDGRRLVGYWIGRAHWGRGLATIALAGLVRELDERPLHAEAAATNVASLRVLAKCGFVETRREIVVDPVFGEVEEVFLELRGPA